MMALGPEPALADDPLTFRLAVDPPRDGADYSYRRANYDKTVNIMLYGFKDQPGAGGPAILKDRKALKSFFREHWENTKRDFLGGQDAALKFSAGDESFTAPVNRGAGIDPAKMVGVTVPYGRFTFGGGYSWGEKNPAYMLRTADGLIVGMAYDRGETGVQVSWLNSGQKLMGFKVGGSSVPYSSVMIGTSFRIKKFLPGNGLGMTATAQFRQDEDPLTNGDQDAVFTIGTKWKF